MEITNIVEVKTRAKWREWLIKNASSEKFCWLKVSRGMWGSAKDKSATDTLLYIDAVEEALCFGWIDSTSKQGYQRFSPRTKKSNWTQLNVVRCERLEKLGLMTLAGRAAVPKNIFEVSQHITKALQACQKTWQNYLILPDIYRRVRVDNIQTWYGVDDITYNKRLQKFLDNTKEGKLYGEWNDGGRLLEN